VSDGEVGHVLRGRLELEVVFSFEMPSWIVILFHIRHKLFDQIIHNSISSVHIAGGNFEIVINCFVLGRI
jgi:hypothetical protein